MVWPCKLNASESLPKQTLLAKVKGRWNACEHAGKSA